ncbi:MAG: ribonuclease III [Clostridia bacterium]|nr:ribonuclease III [Clostridia bacterium]
MELKKIYKFKDIRLYELARTHTSYSNELKNKKKQSNQRLEFLGDSVLSIMVSEFIYKNYTHFPEGSLTKIRADVVCEKSLYEIAKSIDLGKHLLLGKGEERGGGRERVSILADAMEAFIGAVYLDSDLETAKQAFMPLLVERIIIAASKEDKKDYKTTLQEFLQKNGQVKIVYTTVSESGPDHDKTYGVEVSVNGEISGSGEGKTKKEAEQMAAKNALAKIL